MSSQQQQQQLFPNVDLASLLAVPVQYAVDPLATLSDSKENTTKPAPGPGPRPLARKQPSSSPSAATKKARLSLEDKDEKTKER